MSSIGQIATEHSVAREGLQPERNVPQETAEARMDADKDTVSVRPPRDDAFADAEELTLDQALDVLGQVRSMLTPDNHEQAMVHELDSARVFQLLGMA